MDKDLQRCLDLLKENTENVRHDAEGALLTVCQNILCHPNDKQFREVCLDDPIVEKLLPAIGAMECLFDLGFVEVNTLRITIFSLYSKDLYTIILVYIHLIDY